MAFSSLRLRGAVALSSILSRHQNPPSSYSSSTFVPLFHSLCAATSPSVLLPSRYHWLNFSASFRSSSLSLDRWSENGEGKISSDEILFEGCDYNHWLITMDFPKDPKPTPEQMVETYVETLVKVVGSREEAMKRMYACSTTTYTGFQAVMTEEMSEKFRGLPGVVFILPDSYIDPVNKEYGGDKYEMGKITPRPPPVQYGRQGRYGDRNRNYDRPRYDRPRESMPMQHANPPYNNQGPSPSGGTNYGQQQPHSPQGHWQVDGQNYTPQQTYNPPGQQGSQWQSPTQGHGVNHTAQQNYYQGERGGAPSSYQRDFNQDGRGNFATQDKGRFSEGQYGGRGGPDSFGGRGFTQGPSSNYGQYPGTQEGQNFQGGENRGNVHSEQPNLNIPGNFGKNKGQF